MLERGPTSYLKGDFSSRASAACRLFLNQIGTVRCDSYARQMKYYFTRKECLERPSMLSHGEKAIPEGVRAQRFWSGVLLRMENQTGSVL